MTTEVDNVTREELKLIYYVVVWGKPITEHNLYDVNKFYRACGESFLGCKTLILVKSSSKLWKDLISNSRSSHNNFGPTSNKDSGT